jgi:acyl-CoA synthetase (NDP forming)
MRTFFYPRSLAIIGVSPSPSNFGRGILENLERFGFREPIYLVGPGGGELEGQPIFENLTDLPEIPELAVIIVPARVVPEAVESCGQKGITRVAVETGGFSEFGDEGRRLEADIVAIAKKWGMRLMGPNCIATINAENGLVLPFVPFEKDEVTLGRVSLIAQSGGVVHDLVRRSGIENLGLNKLVSMGNKLGLNENDFLEFAISDPGTEVIGLYLEDFRDGRRLMDLASATDKPIIALKANATPAGSDIARFHTSALLGDTLVAEAALKQAGIHRVKDPAELIECMKIFTLPLMKGPRIALVSRSGGHAVILADAAYRHGLELAGLPNGLVGVLKKKVKAGVIRFTNPLDLGDVFDLETYGDAAEAFLKDENVDGLAWCHDYGLEEDRVATAKFLERAAGYATKYGKPVAFCLVPEKKHWIELKQRTPMPLFNSIDTALWALARSLEHFRLVSARHGRRQELQGSGGQGVRRGSSEVPPNPRLLGQGEAFQLLAEAGLPVADYGIARNREEALEVAAEIGYPVACKVAAPVILHKTEAGGVQLSIRAAADLAEAVAGMQAKGYLIQKMVPPGPEIILGGKRDPAFGPVVLLGVGGIFTEVFQDVAVRVAPVSMETALEMIEELKGAALLKGFRGQPPSDVAALAACVVKASRMLLDHPEIVNLDMNPIVVFKKEKGCAIVDVKMEIAG